MASVKSVLAQCLTQYNGILNSTLNTAEPKLQEQIQSLIAELSGVWQCMNNGAVSRNEELDDIPTAALPIVVVPYILGDVQLRVAGPTSTREQILDSGKKLLNEFLSLCIDLRIVTEKDVEIGCHVDPSNRTLRVEQHRQKKALASELAQLDTKLQYLAAKSANFKKLIEGEDALTVDTTSEEEEVLRNRSLTHIRLCILEAFSTIQSAAQESEMLSRLTERQRERVSAEYQAGIAAAKRGELSSSQETYTVLPGGVVTPAVPLRQLVRDQAFVDRNPTTMTLREFAEMQMRRKAEEAEKMQAAAEAAKREEEELGPEGIEERDRQKAAQWDDWRDGHPPIGKTTKGNYT